MATEMITLKLEDGFLDNIDAIVKKEGYQSRTEFIRNALREKVEQSKLKEAMIELSILKGASNKKTSDKELEKLRELAFEKIDSLIK
jgi:metal-responsive CopG/Arc/MetJ family transcriptional regulator